MQVEKQQLELDMEQQTGSKSGKEYVKSLYCHCAYLLICRVRHAKCRAEWSTNWNQDCQGNINHLRYADDTTLMAESKGELKSLLMKVKVVSEKDGLKLNIQKSGIWSHHFMANRWGTNWNSDRLYFGPKSLQMVAVTMKLNDSCSLEEKLWQT